MSVNGSVHGSNVSPDLPVQGQVIQQILAAAPSRDHSVRVFLPTSLSVYRHTSLSHLSLHPAHTTFFPSISLGKHGSETLTFLSLSFSFPKPDCHPLPPRYHHARILSSHLGRAGCLGIQDGLYPNPRRSTAREAHANMPALVRRSYVSPPFASTFSVFVVPVWVEGKGVAQRLLISVLTLVRSPS